jgi:hypothetical protein
MKVKQVCSAAGFGKLCGISHGLWPNYMAVAFTWGMGIGSSSSLVWPGSWPRQGRLLKGEAAKVFVPLLSQTVHICKHMQR